MGSINENAPSWADQWGSGGMGTVDEANAKSGSKDSKNKKMAADVKAAATVGLGKAKAAATIGAQKVKAGTSVGIKWMKTQYQKRNSK